MGRIVLRTAIALVFSLGFVLGVAPRSEADIPDTEVPDEVVNRMGVDLTPMGAEKSGNGAGTIPRWDGGMDEPPENIAYQIGDNHPDPFADDPVLFTITAQNLDQHADKLTKGFRAMFEHYPETYYMQVKQTRRTCAYPPRIYENLRHNAKVGRLEFDGNGVLRAIGGSPFPIPSNGLEMIWNHMLNAVFFKATRQFTAASPTRGGSYTLISVQDEAIIHWADPSKKAAEELDNISVRYIAHTTAPARLAGNVVLVHETLNQSKGPRKAWVYSPGTRRVRRAPDIAYDNPGTNSDGLSTTDSYFGFNGSPDRYDWTVIGKREFYIPYNAYEVGLKSTTYDELIQPNHIDPKFIRHELHRLWILEARLRDGVRHLHPRRTMYLHEDGWSIMTTELYDPRGDLWRHQQGYPKIHWEVPVCGGSGGAIYDFNAHRYLVLGLTAQEPQINFFADELEESRYTPDSIRRLGVR